MLQFLEKVRFSIAALLLGGLFMFLGYYRVVDVKPPKISGLDQPNLTFVICGAALLLIASASGVVSQFGDAIWLPDFARRVKSVQDGWCTSVGGANIYVTFGKIEEIAKPVPSNLVVLPANEFFDDECITDRNSSLGAFVAAQFPRQESDLLALVTKRLSQYQTTTVERARNIEKASYGVGVTAFLRRPLGTAWNLLLAAATTQRAGEGLRAEIATIFSLTNEVARTMADHRLTDVTVPLIGSGHGGLRKSAALSAIVVAFIEVLRRPAAHGIKNVKIVVFRASDTDSPEISSRLVRRVVARAVDLYAT